MTADSSSSPALRSIRWWPALLILALGAAVFAFWHFTPQASRQHQWMKEAATLLATAGGLLIWFLFLSRLPKVVRKTGLWIVLAGTGLLAACFRYGGVSGDLMPIFHWRWSGADLAPLNTQISTNATLPPAPPGAKDYPQFFGPMRTGQVEPLPLVTNWSAHPPQQLWRQVVGQAWSGFAVAGSAAVTQEQRGGQELAVCYDLATGKILWSHADETRHDDPLGGVGPRATPAIEGGRVYTQGATGLLNCLDLATGALVWSKNVIQAAGASEPEYGLSCSPLLRGDWVIICPGNAQGGTLAAYHNSDGTRLWIGGNQSASYSSPVVATLGGVEQILQLGPRALAGYDPASGKLLWEFPFKPEMRFPHIAIPVVLPGDRIHISAGYGKGSSLAHVQKEPDGQWVAEEIWTTNRMKAKFTNLVLHQGHLYGLDDGVLACQDAETGDLKWRDGRYGHGQVILSGNLLLVMAEDGNVVLVEPNPESLKELTRFQALKDKTWNPPALAGEYLLVRNDKEAACYRLPVQPSPPS